MPSTPSRAALDAVSSCAPRVGWPLIGAFLSYDATDIQVLEGLDAVRKRPGMYIGSTGERGLHHLVTEVVDNSVDEAMAGFAGQITVTLRDDGLSPSSTTAAASRSMMHPVEQRPAVEVVLTVLHAGGKFGGGGYSVSGGLHGVGVSVVNALSSAARRRDRSRRVRVAAVVPTRCAGSSPGQR